MRFWAWVAALVYAAASAAQSGVIAGRVVTADGEPVEGATVQAMLADAERGSVLSDDRGEFRLWGLRAGSYRLRVELHGGKAWTYPVGQREAGLVAVGVGQEVDGREFVVPPEGVSAPSGVGERVAGRVVEWRGGGGVSGAEVELVGGSARWAVKSDGDGGFAFARVPAGSYQIVVRSAGHLRTLPDWVGETESRTPKVEAGKPVEGVRLRLLPEGVATGRVTAGGEPVAGALVSANRLVRWDDGTELQEAASAYTDDRGDFRLAHLALGQYYIAAAVRSDPAKVRGPEPSLFPEAKQFSDAMPVTVAAGIPATVDVSLSSGSKHVIRGELRVPDGAANVHVLLWPEDSVLAMKFGPARAELDAHGAFVARDVWQGGYIVRAEGQVGEQSFAASTSVEVGDRDVAVGVLVLAPLMRVQGIVRAAGNAACAMDGAEVELLSADGDGIAVAHAAVDHGGRFIVEKVARGNYVASVRNLTGNCYADDATLHVSDAAAPAEVVLRTDGGRVTGTVMDRSGRVVSGMRVALQAAGTHGEHKLAVTDARGMFVSEGLRPGTYRVAPVLDEAMDANTTAQDVEIDSGSDVSVSITAQ